MKNPLRLTLDTTDNKIRLNVKEGQCLFYIRSKIFGKIMQNGPNILSVAWETKPEGQTSSYSYDRLLDDSVSTELLDYCILCETEEDKLFVNLKYSQ